LGTVKYNINDNLKNIYLSIINDDINFYNKLINTIIHHILNNLCKTNICTSYIIDTIMIRKKYYTFSFKRYCKINKNKYLWLKELIHYSNYKYI